MKEIIVYEVYAKQSAYLEKNVGVIMDMIKDLDDGASYTITKTSILESEYEKLPEFMGF